jgi:pimeloyl-ACP methyl ester carboxylesterase
MWVPTLVLHGADDVMCDVSGGRATAAAVPGAKLVIIDGMGHSLPRQLWGS